MAYLHLPAILFNVASILFDVAAFSLQTEILTLPNLICFAGTTNWQ
jgi:hypothetical protein